jgi:hypothetical protein
MVNKTYYDFILSFEKNETFTVRELMQRHNVTIENQAFYDTIMHLIEKNIFKIDYLIKKVVVL